MESLLPLLLIFAVMMLPLLFMSSRQKKMQRKQQELVNALGVGDEVRTHSGFYGLIVDSFDDIVILESENGAQTKWARQAIAMKVDPEGLDDENLDEDADDEALEGESSANRGDVPGVTTSDDAVRDEDRRDR
ncbi:preprotein translocase subunit YajC [Brachybacterium sp. GCM10030267]|uniref:preprotein translocase subunit YajC n=1 Tax=Brachybacterium sp. GCM10030267 TaxID=3273381 RepID=UPI0036074DE7